MNLYLIDDGENWWITGDTPAEALQLARAMDIDEEKKVMAGDLEMVPHEQEMRVFLPDFHPLDLNADDYPNKPKKDEKDRWFVTATVAEWVDGTPAGSLIASSIY